MPRGRVSASRSPGSPAHPFGRGGRAFAIGRCAPRLGRPRPCPRLQQLHRLPCVGSVVVAARYGNRSRHHVTRLGFRTTPRGPSVRPVVRPAEPDVNNSSAAGYRDCSSEGGGLVSRIEQSRGHVSASQEAANPPKARALRFCNAAGFATGSTRSALRLSLAAHRSKQVDARSGTARTAELRVQSSTRRTPVTGPAPCRAGARYEPVAPPQSCRTT
jgi:hypothetical protein